jgi:DNA mismatch endonuclease (patch repair protein)
MADTISPARRSWNMSRIRSKNTKPEIVVRSTLHKMGFRFRLHRKDLPGTPDIVLPKHNTVIFVQGCFWHRHQGCKYAYTPKSRAEFWEKKFAENTASVNAGFSRYRFAGLNATVLPSLSSFPDLFV